MSTSADLEQHVLALGDFLFFDALCPLTTSQHVLPSRRQCLRDIQQLCGWSLERTIVHMCSCCQKRLPLEIGVTSAASQSPCYFCSSRWCQSCFFFDVVHTPTSSRRRLESEAPSSTNRSLREVRCSGAWRRECARVLCFAVMRPPQRTQCSTSGSRCLNQRDPEPELP